MRLLKEFWYGNIELMEYSTAVGKEYREVLRIRKNAEFQPSWTILQLLR